ncbi:LysR family transcriptional regulator [Acidaminococcus timonensis]|uniref:LysR family transcriptional regulator n=1 Tax=Acidaminococcus timonensis TaxID=1871002 RepID=UPI0029421DA6|nr:LysR family transcriptional regulator [Acidaminococcus timonensis]
MNTRYLTYILTIAKRKNMTKAAEELYISQSSLSQYLTKLEKELGTSLFYRTKWELIPTPAGELYIEACKKVLAIKEDLYRQIKELDNAGNIAVGTTSQFGLKMMTEIVPKFKEKYPNFNITISHGNLPLVKKMLMEETIDVAFLADTEISPAFKDTSEVLRQEEVLFEIPRNHPYALKHPESSITVDAILKNFTQDKLFMHKDGSSLKKVYEQLFGKRLLKNNILMETNSISTITYMIAGGEGISFIAESCSKERDKIRYYSMNPPAYRLNLFIWRKNWIIHAPEAYFCELVRNYFKNHTEHPYIV